MAFLIIVGGGNSISAFPTLWDDIAGCNVMAVNYAYKFTKEMPRYIVSIDPGFWKNNQHEMDEYAAWGCKLIGRNREYVLVEKYYPNGNMFRGQRKLSGIFALDYATRKLNCESIFLFGYDFGVIDGKTHFYDKPYHRGINKTKAYLDGNCVHPAVSDFDVFAEYEIAIVGKSHISSFPKIEYDEFKQRIEKK